MRLCKPCAESERKKSGWRQDGPGLYSMAIPRMSNCQTCKTQSHGYSLCAACAVENGYCQGCFTQMKASPTLLSEIAGHRQMKELRESAAHERYTKTIEPFKDEVAKFERAIAASETQLNADCEPFWEAARIADEKFRRVSPYSPETERIAASTAYFDAHKASEANSSSAFERELERNRVLMREFAQYDTYSKAVGLRKRTEERASATFSAAVDRSIEIANAEAERQSAVEKAEARYKRALEFQDSLDRLLSI